jgi:hypothetical protein
MKGLLTRNSDFEGFQCSTFIEEMHEFIVLFIAEIRYYSYNLVHIGSLYETYQDFYVRRLLNIIQNCQIYKVILFGRNG